MDGAGAPDRGRRRLGQSEPADFPRDDQFGHRADGLLDRHARIDAVLIVQVDDVQAEPLQRCVAGAPHVLGRSVDAEERAVRATDVAELRGEHDLIAPSADRRADELLVRERAVHVGRVEEIDADVERAVNRRDRLRLVPARIELGHPHAAEADRGHAQAGSSELPVHFHLVVRSCQPR